MYTLPVGISILTNGSRLSKLKESIDSLLFHCYYRPLVIGIFNNGSTDDTRKWLERIEFGTNPYGYGISLNIEHSDTDLGCAAGTNRACNLVRDCEFAIHLESDFSHLSPEESGEDRLWLRRAIEFMQEVNGNYLYLRRMTGEQEMMAHWWSQWMPKIVEQKGKYLSCPDFWWSNNPALRRNQALYDSGTLPLDVSKDGPKGTPGWSQPELTAKAPGRSWIHRWGLFVHDRETHGDIFKNAGCGAMKDVGISTCKYGFFKTWSEPFCNWSCNRKSDFRDMPGHEIRFKQALVTK